MYGRERRKRKKCKERTGQIIFANVSINVTTYLKCKKGDIRDETSTFDDKKETRRERDNKLFVRVCMCVAVLRTFWPIISFYLFWNTMSFFLGVPPRSRLYKLLKNQKIFGIESIM